MKQEINEIAVEFFRKLESQQRFGISNILLVISF